MKILHISMNANYTEGYGYQDNLLPEYQVKLGHEVYLITSVFYHGEKGIEEVKECDYINDKNVHVYRRKNKGLLGRVKSIFGIYNFKKEINEIKPDLIMIHGLCNMLIIQVTRYKHKVNPQCHIIMDNHQDSNNTKISNFVLALARTANKLSIKRHLSDIDKVYGVTSWRVDYAKEAYGIPSDKLDILLLGYDTDKIDFINADNVRHEIRSDNNIADSDFVFLTGGRLAKDKKIIETIKAFMRIKNENISFIIFGPVYNDIKEEFEELIKKDARIKYIGPVPSERICDYCMSSDLGVFAGGHSVIWEQAVGVGLPCIFRSYGENTHLDVGGNCILLDECDENTIYNAISDCLNDSNKYDDMKRSALEKGVKSFSYYEIAKKSLECTEMKES